MRKAVSCTFPMIIVLLLLWLPQAWGAPTAAFSAMPTTWNAPAVVQFADTSPGKTTSWLWNFGDGTQSTAKNPTHQYQTPGTYQVSLTVGSSDGTATEVKNSYIKVEEYIPQADEYVIHADASALQRFGLYYPVTYKFRLPQGSQNLSAQYRHWEGTWQTLPERKSADRFNGINAARFDYSGGFAYLSVSFDRSSDNIYLRIIDGSGQPVPVEFSSIPRFYDGRKAAATFTLDDWTSWSDTEFRAASDYLSLYGLYFTVGLIMDGVPWSSVQQKIDQHGQQMEVSSHSYSHPKDAAGYAIYGYEAEILGSRDAIRNNLTFPDHPYVPSYLEPFGHYDTQVNTWITAADYLVSRGDQYAQMDSPFAPWDSTQGRYGRAGITFDDQNYADDGNLLAQANALFDDALAAGSIYHLADHPNEGRWHDGSYLLQHLNYVKGRNDVWYVPFGQLYQYHFIQEMRGNLTIQHYGATPLAAGFSASPVSGTSPLSVAFTDTSTGTITGWQWDFGDSSTSTDRNPVHVYANPGSYTVRLTVTGPAGAITRTVPGFITVTTPSIKITAPANESRFAAPATISIAATATVAPGTSVSRVDFYSGTQLLGTSVSSPYTFVWTNVTAGNYSLTAKVTDSQGKTATSVAVNVTVLDSSLPTPWSTRDIGSVGRAGSAVYDNGAFLLNGSGNDIWGASDSFRFVYQPLTGDGQIIARVATLQEINSWTKGGVMIRESLSANSSHALMAVTPGNGAVFQRRLSSGGSSLSTFGPLVTAPYWVKLVRKGNTFSGYVSSNGQNWVLVGSDTINAASTVYAGLAVTAHSNTVLCSSTMDNVSVTAGTPVTPPRVTISSPLDGASYKAPAIIPISVTATAGTGASVSRVDFYNGTTLLGTSTVSPYSYTWNNVAAGSYSLTAQITDSLGSRATSDPVQITVTTPSIPSWDSMDIGNVGLAGSASYANGSFTISGAGGDIWGRADAFRYVYQSLSGDGQIIARVATQQNTNSWAKAGVMIRQSLAVDAPHAFMAVTPTSGAVFQRRPAAGGYSYSTAVPLVKAPYWVKLVRSGDQLSGHVSSNGVDWVLVGSEAIPMTGTVYVGLAVTSHSTTTLCTATMDGVTGNQVIPPTVAITAPASGASYATPATIAITASATPGTSAAISKVEFYAGATLIGTSTTSPYSVTWSNAPAGSHTLTARVTDSLNRTATSSPVAITVADPSLPAPWLAADIGTVGVAGAAAYLNGVFTISGSGADIWGRADSFRFVYRQLTGDGQIIARVASLQNTNSWSKAGVMIRESLAANSANAIMAMTVSKGAVFQRRQSAGALTLNTNGQRVALPQWVKITRSGDTISGYLSADGVNWVLVGSDTIVMGRTVYMGLAVTSHDATALCTATMDEVGLTGL